MPVSIFDQKVSVIGPSSALELKSQAQPTRPKLTQIDKVSGCGVMNIIFRLLELLGSAKNWSHVKIDCRFGESVISNLVDGKHCAILLDTWCFAENPKLYTEKDKIIVEELYRKISYPTFVGLLKDEELIDGDHLFEDLLSVRCNLTHLTVLQILKKDLKISCGIPIPVLPVLLQEFLKLHTIEELQKFTKDFEYKGIILIGVTFSNGRYAQDIAVFSTDKYFLDLMTDTLVTSRDPDLQLNEVTVYANMEYIKVFTQQNFKATRKQILPIVREFMRHFLSPPTEG
ncbi:uncharacterized protein LOC126471048 [Schistocerca serialis cubense]|uniref:uncharacterized protein LOC126471048 n=1 Tax=Schistocerca serialis cubense TaxID=2023355 RepID=UPI00214F554E|nr:uncharacterized protein LOC126471048 [Schistocerca serialis cubense]